MTLGKKATYYLKLLSLPLSVLALSISLRLIWGLFDFPPLEVLLPQLKELLGDYGLPILLVSAMLEGMLLVGAYFPGLFVICVSVLLADSVVEAAVAIFVGTVGLLVAHVANYALGKYGWYNLLVKFGLKGAIDESRENLVKRGPWAVWGSYWLPSMSALTDTAAGIIRMPFRTFFTHSVLASFFWDTVAGTIMYVVGEPMLYVVGGGSSSGDIAVPLILVSVWSAIILAMDYWKHREVQTVGLP